MKYGFLILSGLFLLVLAFLTFFRQNSTKPGVQSEEDSVNAHFAKPREARKIYRSVPFEPARWRAGEHLPGADCQGIITGLERRHGKPVALVDTSDVHALMIGAAGVGKTAYFLYPNLEYACACGMSFLATDTKGDLFRHYAAIAENDYGYRVSVLDLRNPTRSSGNNLLHLVNRYTDLYREHPEKLAYKARAEKYAKIISKTIILSGEKPSSFGQNAFFYDAAEGLLTSVILLVAEFCPEEERHIVSVFKVIQDLMSGGEGKGAQAFQSLLNHLPKDHKARWFAGAALSSSKQAMASVMSTAMSRLNAFLDSELEQILCFGTTLDAETFCREKSALFIVMPEEDNSKYFMVSLTIQQYYREILSVADESGGRLGRRVMFYLDEFGTIPKIESADMMFSASRSRRISILAIIQSFAQLRQNYGKEGSEIIEDNTQLTIFGGFAPQSGSAEALSKALGTRTVQSASITIGDTSSSECLSMVQKPLLSAEALKALPKGTFVVTKTGALPMKTEFCLYSKWGITFPEESYEVPEQGNRRVAYADKDRILKSMIDALGTELEVRANERMRVVDEQALERKLVQSEKGSARSKA